MPHRPIATLIRNQGITTASPDQTVKAAAQLMAMNRVAALPIVEGNRLVGIFTERDAVFRVIAEGLDPATTPLAKVMTENPQTTTPDRPFAHAMHLMFEGGFRHVPVVVDGRPVGMVSSRDALGPELREFAREIEDREHISEIL